MIVLPPEHSQLTTSISVDTAPASGIIMAKRGALTGTPTQDHQPNRT